ncbi:MAG: tetratricopeptide repeat protein, partial [Halieaceae bacterium]
MNPPDQETAQRLQAGFEALNRGQLDIAANACQQVLAEHPDLAAAHFLVGLVAVEGDERRVAHEAFKSVIKLDRNHAAAWAQLARLNASEGRIALAEDALKEVRRIKPSDPAVLDLTGTVLNQLGEYETAKAFFAAVNRAAPGQTPYMMNLANALVFNGDIDAAVDVFREVIRLDPRSAQPHWGLANAVKATDTQHIAQMRTLVTKYAENDRAQSFLYYAIGKECEDLEDW